MAALRVVFMGSPEPAVAVLDALLNHAGERGWEVAAVYTAPDRPAGRGRVLRAAPVKERALERGLRVLSPVRLRPEEEQERFKGLGAGLVVLAAYGLLLPPAFLDPAVPGGPAHGALNIHPSLLPRWRGASPVASAILEGDTETGVSLMRMDAGLDTGPVLAQERVRLDGTERTPELTARLFALGAGLLTRSLDAYLGGTLAPVPQPEEGVRLSSRLSKEEGLLDWAKPAAALERQVRAFDPWPGAYTTWRGLRVEVLEAATAPGTAQPGQVVRLEGGAGVGTGEGLLRLERVRQEGKRGLGAQEFLRGQPSFEGSRLPS